MVSDEIDDYRFKEKLPIHRRLVNSHADILVKAIRTEAPQVAARDGVFMVGTHIFVTGDQTKPAGNHYQRALAKKRGEGLKLTKSPGASQEHHRGHYEKTQEVSAPEKPGNPLRRH